MLSRCGCRSRSTLQSAPLALLVALACGGGGAEATVAVASSSAGGARREPALESAATAVAAWSTTRAECDGVFIASRRHCHRTDDSTPKQTLSPTSALPQVLVLGRFTSPGDAARILERCVVRDEHTVLPVEGLELEIELDTGLPPMVVRADEGLDVDLLACTALVVRARIDRPGAVTVVFFPGDLNDRAQRTLDDRGPRIFVQLDEVGWPLTKASALRLLRFHAPRIRGCFEARPDPNAPYAISVELRIERDGSAIDVKTTSESPGDAELARCVRNAHYALTTTVYAEDGSTRMRVRYHSRSSTL
jgi:hypothetical protein